MINLKKLSELAEGLQKSNVEEVRLLAEGFLGLKVAYDELEHAHIVDTARRVMDKHRDLLERLKND